MTIEHKRKSPEEMIQTMTETMASHYEEKAMFNQMIEDVAEGCISTIVTRNVAHEVEAKFARFIKENNIKSFDELESEQSFELIEDGGSITYKIVQQYRKKKPTD